MNPHSYRLKGRDFVHQGKIEIEVNERAVFIRTQGCFFVYTNSDCFLNSYIEGVMAPDGEEQDAYILGVNEPVKKFTGKIIAIVRRKDDIEEKWVVVPDGVTFSKEEIRRQIHFQEQYFDSEIVM